MKRESHTGTCRNFNPLSVLEEGVVHDVAIDEILKLLQAPCCWVGRLALESALSTLCADSGPQVCKPPRALQVSSTWLTRLNDVRRACCTGVCLNGRSSQRGCCSLTAIKTGGRCCGRCRCPELLSWLHFLFILHHVTLIVLTLDHVKGIALITESVDAHAEPKRRNWAHASWTDEFARLVLPAHLQRRLLKRWTRGHICRTCSGAASWWCFLLSSPSRDPCFP